MGFIDVSTFDRSCDGGDSIGRFLFFWNYQCFPSLLQLLGHVTVAVELE